MKKLGLMGWALGVALLACGGSSETDSGGAGASSSNGGGGSGASSSGGMGGSAQTGGGGSGGEAGMGGGPDCPDISCSKVCPTGTWPELNSCPSCACAAGLEMVVDGQSRPAQHVTVTPMVTEFIGGIDRWIFDLTWQYDDPMISDEAEDVAVSVALMRIDPQYEPAEQNASWCYPEDVGMPFEDRGTSYTLFGFAQITNDLAMVDGFLSIRQNGNQFEGQAYFDFNPVNDGPTVHVAAPFTVPVP